MEHRFDSGWERLYRVLSQKFFRRPTLRVAKELLGKFLVRRVVEVRPALRAQKDEPNFLYPVRRIGSQKIIGMITEVEAYIGPRDLASHASRLWRGSPRAARGRTRRTEVMFGKPGCWYVYLIYGMHHCLNIVTEREGYPAAILIRSVLPCSDGTLCIYSRSRVNAKSRKIEVNDEVEGPGRVCRYFAIDRSLNGRPTSREAGLWIEDRGIKIPPRRIGRGRRIGVEYAGQWKDKLWRMYLKA